MKTMLKIFAVLTACIAAIAGLCYAINTISSIAPVKKYILADSDDDSIPF